MEIIDTSTWEKDEFGWSMAPAGLSWIKEGAYAKIGSYAVIGSDAVIGSYAKIGSYAVIGAGAKIGSDAVIGSYAKIGSYAVIGSDARIGANSTFSLDLGWCDGYRKTYCEVNDVAYIGAGCRWFTLDEAIKHWSNKPDRVMTLCLMESAKALAKLRNMKTSEVSK
jgi:NDP-sugar pyrophosphorylase family protein